VASVAAQTTRQPVDAAMADSEGKSDACTMMEAARPANKSAATASNVPLLRAKAAGKNNRV